MIGARQHQLGIALLIVLAALVVSTSAIAIVATASNRHRLSRAAADDQAAAQDLVMVCRSPIRSWLVNQARDVVLPTDVAEPAVEVLHDRWEVGGTLYDVRITAWDQCGMLPVAAFIHGHPIAQGANADAAAAATELPPDWTRSPGLDQFAPEHSVFPHLSTDTDVDRADPHLGSEPVALGGLLSTHNTTEPGRVRRGRAPILLNLNTTPLPLLERALRLEGIGGLEQIRESRQAGQPIGGNELKVVANDRNRENSDARFVSQSVSWAVRIDVRVGISRESIWEVWTHTSGGWRPVQRLAIDE